MVRPIQKSPAAMISPASQNRINPLVRLPTTVGFLMEWPAGGGSGTIYAWIAYQSLGPGKMQQ